MIFYTNNYINNILNNNINDKYYFHYLYIISYIRTYRFKDRQYDKLDYVPMNIDILRKLINYDNAHKFVKQLIDFGIIECDNTFSRIKGESKGYRLTKDTLSCKFFTPKKTDEKLILKIKNAYNKLKIGLIKEDSYGYGYVTECMEGLKIDKKQALLSISNLEGDKKEVSQMAIESFDFKFFSKDSKGNRLHNNLTNLYSPLRKYLSYGGSRLVQCDIRNSQLVFLYMLMRTYNVPIKELDKFKSVVCEYGFYEFFAEKLETDLTEETRKSFKQSIFKDLLFGVNKTKLSKTEQIFKEEFPTIFYIIRSIKTDNYKSLSIMLQKEESSFIFECVRKFKKSIPLFTIHDSIVTTEGNEGLVYWKIKKEFENKFSISPKIKVEKFA